APATRPAPRRRGCRHRCRSAPACRRNRSIPASRRRSRRWPPSPRPRPDATAAPPAHAPAAARQRPSGTAWAPARRSGYRGRRRAPRPRPGWSWHDLLRRVVRARLRGGRGRPGGRRVLDHAVELLAGLDHAQLAARALLDGGLAFLEVLDLGGERVVALLQAFVVALL